VADASIMPSVVAVKSRLNNLRDMIIRKVIFSSTGNLMTPTIMMGDKAAAMILRRSQQHGWIEACSSQKFLTVIT